MRERRAGNSLQVVATELGLTHTTLSRIERGTHAPSLETARALATWLGWSIEQVIAAAETPADPPPTDAQEATDAT